MTDIFQSFDQYIAATLPPFFQCVDGSTLAPFNVYTIVSGCKVYLPNIKTSQNEVVIVINTDSIIESNLEAKGYAFPEVLIRDGEDKFVNAAIAGQEFSKASLPPGAIHIYIKRGNTWKASGLHLSQYIDQIFRNTDALVKANRSDVAIIKTKQVAIDDKIEFFDEAIKITQFAWFSYNDLFNGFLFPPLVFDNANISYWSFELDELEEDFVIKYPGNNLFGAKKIVRILDTDLDNESRYIYILQPNGTNLDGTVPLVEIENDDGTITQYHEFGSRNLYEIYYDSQSNTIFANSVGESVLPQPKSIKTQILENKERIDDFEILRGAEFPTESKSKIFFIDSGVKYPHGLYVLDANKWIAQF